MIGRRPWLEEAGRVRFGWIRATPLFLLCPLAAPIPRGADPPGAQPIPTNVQELFTSPAIADLVLAVLVLEGVGLALWRRRRGGGPRPGAVLPFLVAGGCLVLALRAVLADAPWPWTAAALVGSLMAHLWQLREAWNGPDEASG